MTAADRRRECALRGPAQIQTAGDYVLAQTCACGPIGKAQRVPVELDAAGASRIALLLGNRRPHNIARLVAEFIVQTFNGVSRGRTRAEIREEVLEALPSRADVDAPSTVVREAVTAWVAAALKHSVPRLVFGGVIAGKRVTVLHVFAAPATCRVTAPQIAVPDQQPVAALADARPKPDALASAGAEIGLYRRQISERHSGKISCAHSQHFTSRRDLFEYGEESSKGGSNGES